MMRRKRSEAAMKNVKRVFTFLVSKMYQYLRPVLPALGRTFKPRLLNNLATVSIFYSFEAMLPKTVPHGGEFFVIIL
jgi:hypothetical protein